MQTMMNISKQLKKGTYSVMNYKVIRRNRQRQLLIITFIFVFLCSPLSFLVAADVAAVQYFFNIAKVLLFILGVLYLVKARIFNRMTFAMFVYVGFYILSTIINNGSIYTAFNVSIGFLGVYIWTEYFICKMPELYLKTFLKYMSAMIIANLVTIILFPNGLSINEYNSYVVRLIGIDNSLASILYPTVILSYVQFYRGKIKYSAVKLLLVAVCITEFLVLSATSIIGLIPLLWGFYAVRSAGKNNRIELDLKKVVLIYLLAFYFVNISLSNSNITNFIANIFHKSLNFSGRTYIWEKAIEIISRKMPWIGYGAYNKELLRTIYFLPANCHSFLFELIISVGIIGTVLFLYMFFIAYKRTTKLGTCGKGLVSCLICYFAIVLSMGIAEATSLYLANFMFLAMFYHSNMIVEAKSS